MVNPLACDPACFLPGVVPGFETGVVLAKVRPKPNSRCPSQPKVAKAAGLRSALRRRAGSTQQAEHH